MRNGLLSVILLFSVIPAHVQSAERWVARPIDPESRQAGWQTEYRLQLPDRVYTISIGEESEEKEKVAVNATDKAKNRRLHVYWVKGMKGAQFSEPPLRTPKDQSTRGPRFLHGLSPL